RIPGEGGRRPQRRRGAVVGPGDVRRGGPEGHRPGRRVGRPGHGRPVHGGLARDRQVAVVRRGPPAGGALTRVGPVLIPNYICITRRRPWRSIEVTPLWSSPTRRTRC